MWFRTRLTALVFLLIKYNLIHFTVEGPATIAGVGNGNPVSVESYQLPQRKAWRGRCMVVIKSKGNAGKIFLKATAENFKPAEVIINSK